MSIPFVLIRHLLSGRRRSTSISSSLTSLSDSSSRPRSNSQAQHSPSSHLQQNYDHHDQRQPDEKHLEHDEEARVGLDPVARGGGEVGGMNEGEVDASGRAGKPAIRVEVVDPAKDGELDRAGVGGRAGRRRKRALTWDPSLVEEHDADDEEAARPSSETSLGGSKSSGCSIPYLLSSAWDTRHDRSKTSIWKTFSNWLWAKDVVADSATEGDDRVQAKFRWTPILSGLIVPFSILLEIPGLTEHWYATSASIYNNNIPTVYRPNPILLDVGLAISMASALVANLALISRFLERRVARWTMVAIIALAIHDLINVTAIVVFGVVHRSNDGYVYAEAYWMTVGSTAASLFVNVSLVWDWHRTEDFAKSGSGLTAKQRKLVITVMVLLGYIALGALAYSLMLSVSFQDALYFTVVSIETIGFGDILPVSVGSKIFVFFYQSLGIINLAVTVALAQDSLIETWQAAYRRRRLALRLKHREKKHLLAEAASKQHLVEERIEALGVPVWVVAPGAAAAGGARGGGQSTRKMTLNLDALETALDDQDRQIQIIAEEGGVEDEGKAKMDEEVRKEIKRLKTLDPAEVARQARTRIDADVGAQKEEKETFEELTRKLEREERREFWYKLAFAGGLFILFWLIGSVVFMQTESWSFFISIYFCYIAFSTIGYGDYSPKSPFGRAFFIIWSLFGVAAMTILFSVLGDAFSSQYKKGALTSKTSRTVQDMHARRLSLQGSLPITAPTSSTSTDASRPTSFASSFRTSPLSSSSLDESDSISSLAELSKQLIKITTTFHTHLQYLLHPHHPFEHLPQSLQSLLSSRANEEIGAGTQAEKRELLADEEGRKELFLGAYEDELRTLLAVATGAHAAFAQRVARITEGPRSDSPEEMEEVETPVTVGSSHEREERAK